MPKLLSEVAVGVKFSVNGTEYRRIEDVRVSCCRVVNCVNLADGSNQFVPPNTTVEELNG
jgi:hypothetical protein